MEDAYRDLASCELVYVRRVNSGTLDKGPGIHVLNDLDRELAATSFARDAVLRHPIDFPVTKDGCAQFPMVLPDAFSADSLPFPSSLSPQNMWRWFNSALMPPCSFTGIHTDWAGSGIAMAHIEGVKLWMFWPASPKNLSWLRDRFKHAPGPDTTIAAIEVLEGLHVEILQEPSALIIPPFTLHAVLTLKHSFHVTAPLCSLRWRQEAAEAIDWNLEWHAHVRNTGDPQFADDELRDTLGNLALWDELLKVPDLQWGKAAKADTRRWLKAVRAKEASIFLN